MNLAGDPAASDRVRARAQAEVGVFADVAGLTRRTIPHAAHRRFCWRFAVVLGAFEQHMSIATTTVRGSCAARIACRVQFGVSTALDQADRKVRSSCR
jgi:hypothetical protein